MKPEKQPLNFFFTFIFIITCHFLLQFTYASEEKDWQGKGYENRFTASVLAGLVLEESAAFSPIGVFGYKILDKGFIPDFNDQVFLELFLGPTFFGDRTNLQYGLNMRWDFHKNYLWSFYLISGFGGSTSRHSLPLFPRFGLGSLIHFFELFSFRIELSHEFSGIGVFFQF